MLIPLVIVILLAAKLAYDSYRSLENLKSLDKVVILSTKIGARVHETQKERGMTAGFIGSKGEKFKTELPNQRNLVNDRLKDLNNFLSTFDKSSYRDDFISNLENSLKGLQKLEEVRKMVRDNKYDTKEFENKMKKLENELGADNEDLFLIKMDIQIRKKGGI